MFTYRRTKYCENNSTHEFNTVLLPSDVRIRTRFAWIMWLKRLLKTSNITVLHPIFSYLHAIGISSHSSVSCCFISLRRSPVTSQYLQFKGALGHSTVTCSYKKRQSSCHKTLEFETRLHNLVPRAFSLHGGRSAIFVHFECFFLAHLYIKILNHVGNTE